MDPFCTGIGKEVIPEALRVLDVIQEHTNYSFEYIHLNAGLETFKATGSALPARTLMGIKNCEYVMSRSLGSVTGPH